MRPRRPKLRREMPAVQTMVAMHTSPPSLYVVCRRADDGSEERLLIFARDDPEARAHAAHDIGLKKDYVVLSTHLVAAGGDTQLGGRLKNLHGLLDYIDPKIVNLILQTAASLPRSQSRIHLAAQEPDS